MSDTDLRTHAGTATPDGTRPRREGPSLGLAARFTADLPLSLVTTLTVLVVVVLGAQLLLGALATGVHPDEYIHVVRFGHWLDFGFYVPSSRLVDGLPDPTAPNSSPYVYGAAFSWLAHLVNVGLGHEAMDTVETSKEAYAVRHTLVAVCGLLAAGGAGIAVRSLTRDRLAGLWTAGALLALPVWTGNAMFNVKDIPVGAGYTLLTTGLVLHLGAMNRTEPVSRLRPVALVSFIGVGTFLAVGTRPAMWLPFALTFGAFATFAVVAARSTADLRRVLRVPIGAFALAGLAIAVLHPKSARRPLDWLIESVSGSSDYDWSGRTLTAGQLLDATPPPWYLPAWLVAAVPLLLGLLAVVGLTIAAKAVIERWPPHLLSGEAEVARAGALTLVVLQLVLVPAASVVTGSVMYTGLRQHLYVLPAVAMLAGVGAAWVLRRLRSPAGDGRGVRWGLAAGLTLALVLPAVEQTRLYPYNYIYVSPVAGIAGVQDNWETELQFISSREAFRLVPDGVTPQCALYLTSLTPGGGTGTGPCSVFLRPFRSELSADNDDVAEPGSLWVIGRARGDTQPPDGCVEVDAVTRPLRLEEIVVAHVLRCQPGRAP